ncbi:MAG: polyprenyl synthetase family protein [Candidatus Gastranaerophilales bacterium]|nr:polyprenyl synthetase family protein [Candidatus Gastranaerophilales bacterium]
MDKIIFPIENELKNFEAKLKEVILNSDNFLTYDLEKFIFTNPKRLRPIFIFLFAKILKIDNPLVQNIALITELIHNASLIHDDIIDEEKIRRNNPTFFEKYGPKLAVLEGDLLLSLALEEIGKTNITISRIFASKIKATIQGEIEQNKNNNKITDIETYYKKTFAKTANLFLAGLEALFTLSKENKNLYDFMKNYALAFQIKNDIDNFKTNSSDFKNGNYTLPVIYSSMENKSENLEKYIEKSYKEVEKITKIAINSLKEIENSIYKKTLIDLTNYSLGVNFE